MHFFAFKGKIVILERDKHERCFLENGESRSKVVDQRYTFVPNVFYKNILVEKSILLFSYYFNTIAQGNPNAALFLNRQTAYIFNL